MKNLLLVVSLVFVIASSFGVQSADMPDKDIIIVRMTDFESPAKLNDFFNFQYYLRDASGISDKVVVDFWIEKDGKEAAFGSDSFFLDSSNKTTGSKIFLPSTFQSGVYNFHIRASHGEFISESYRTVEIIIDDGVANIQENGLNNIILISLVLLAILNLGLIYYVGKDKVGKVFNFREAFITGEIFFERHRFTLLAFSSFLIFGALIYYLDYAERLPKTFANAGYFILGVLAVLMLARIIYDKFFSEKFSARTIPNKLIEKKPENKPKEMKVKLQQNSGVLKKINNWLQKDVKFASKKNKAVLKNSTNKKVDEKKIPKKALSKSSAKRREGKNFSRFP